MTTEDVAPREFKGPTERVRKGLLLVYTGNGKGKTTAAFGTVFRALGRGYNVAIVQFIKGEWVSGEIKSLEKFAGQVDYFGEGEGFTWDTKDLKRDVAAAERAWGKCRDLLKANKHDVYLFDEILYALKYKFLHEDEILNSISRRNPSSHVILTGRDASPKILEVADLVTEMKEVKHPYKQGITAQPGIDY